MPMGAGSRRGWMVGGVITAEAEGGYLLPARRSGRAPGAQGAASALGVLVLPKAALGVGCQG